MAKKFEFGIDETGKDTVAIANNYHTTLKEEYNMLFPENKVANFYRTLFRSIAITLKHFETKSNPKIGFSLLNDKGEFRLGAILTYQAPEEGEEDDSGNWNLSFTLNKDDMVNLDNHIDSHSDSFASIARAELYDSMYGHFSDSTSMNRMFDVAIREIIKFLDINSNDGDDVELTLPSIFTATVGIEGGEKVYAIVPGAMVKQLVKDDGSLSN